MQALTAPSIAGSVAASTADPGARRSGLAGAAALVAAVGLILAMLPAFASAGSPVSAGGLAPLPAPAPAVVIGA